MILTVKCFYFSIVQQDTTYYEVTLLWMYPRMLPKAVVSILIVSDSELEQVTAPFLRLKTLHTGTSFNDRYLNLSMAKITLVLFHLLMCKINVECAALLVHEMLILLLLLHALPCMLLHV